MQDFEKLGAFYLGRCFDIDRRELLPAPLLYESKDLTTHALCVGMTGSGKTGLCLTLLEEAAIDGIPAIAIDPKGDLGNLLLTFPELKPGDFQPWVEPSEAARAGLSVEQLAERTAETWKKGLADWGQDGARIARLRSAVDVNIYTPGSNHGLPLSVLKSFALPSQAVLSNEVAFRERVLTTVSGLLALLGIEADPIRSREHILLSNILDHAWRAGQHLDMASLIAEIQKPPFQKLGVMDLETVFPAKERFELSMQLNNLLASPGFAGWMEGEPLDVARLLNSPSGKPRLSILSIAHLSDAERMFFVTTLLGEVIAWMRAQSGTSSLRAILYMDEVFGYFPPTANPPSKQPMLTLLKQARAFGLGVVLATQNPVDLDYKGLSNCGTWFLGRLQTERDKARVLDGLEGASSSAGRTLDRARMDQVPSGLGNRTFLLNNVHEREPVVFQTRWLLSFLRGPLTREQIATLMRAAREQSTPQSTVPDKPASPARLAGAVSIQRPIVPPGIEQVVIAATGKASQGELIYRPAVYGLARVHFVQASAQIDQWRTLVVLAVADDAVPDDVWADALIVRADQLEMDDMTTDARFADVPSPLLAAKMYNSWKTALKNHLYRAQSLNLFECPALKLKSTPSESIGDFRVRVQQQAFERRDAEVEKLRKRFAPKFSALADRMRRAESAVEREKSQASQQTLQTALNVGTTLLGALFGRKIASATNVGRAATSVRSASKIAKERADIANAQETTAAIQEQINQLNEEFRVETERVRSQFADVEILELPITPRKSDLTVEKVALAWLPYNVDANGNARPAFHTAD